MKENGMRARRFREEDHNNRRMFLRSYPLQWEDEAAAKKSAEEISEISEKKLMKKIIVSIIHWSEGKGAIFKRFKDKLTVHIIACIPNGFKAHTNLISA